MNTKSPAEQIALKQEPVSVTDDTATDTLDDFIERAMERIVSKNIDREKLKNELASDWDELDKRGIPYATCPGVSAAFGAASSLDLEYTLPGISQTLIITRMEGRTAVPEKEKIESLAAHHASMAIYLSAGMLDKLCVRLIEGGYSEDTPAAIVYKATWPEEKKLVCTLKTLAAEAAKENITKTAIVLVGDVIEKSGYERSKLYDPTFTTEFRQGKI